MSKLLMSVATLLSNYAKDWEGTNWAWLGSILDFINGALPYILIAVGTFGVIYAVVLGVNMAKAEDAGKREEAKKRIINFVIAIVVTIALIAVMWLVIANLGNWGIKVGDSTTTMIK